MSDTKAPTFSSPDLQQAINDARKTLEGFDDARNQVSIDIKQLETYLEGTGLKTRFYYGLGKMLVDKGDGRNIQMDLEWSGTASGIIEEEALVWGEVAGRYRLLYQRTEWDGYVDVDVPGGPYFCDEATVRRELKPLIETKFEIRKQMYGRLPDFVNALATHLKVDSRPPGVKLFEELKAFEKAGGFKVPF
jgi:hypothetical protein